MSKEIGPYTAYSIETGRFGLDGGAMFGIVPKPLWSERIEADEENRIPLHMRCLLLEGADRLILVDVGMGDTFSGTKYEEIYAVDHEYATLDASLGEHGFDRTDVTDVILTHLHFDHCGGATHEVESGRRPAFPNATYHVQEDHWDWATTPNPKETGSFLQETFVPIRREEQLHLVDGAGTLFPHISVELVHGHTNAQQIVFVGGEETTLVYVADLLPTPHHLAPTWTMAYDVRPLQTIEEKGAFLERAVDEGWTLFFEHDPEVEVGDVVETDRRIKITDPRPLSDL